MIKRVFLCLFLSGLVTVAVQFQAFAEQPERGILTPADRSGNPPRVRDFVQEDVEVEGTLEVLVEDRNDGSRRLSFLETDGGERYSLSFASDAPRFLTGERVKVRGIKVDDAITVESGARDVERVIGARTASIEATTALANTFGAQRTAVILVNFSDRVVQPYTVSYAQSVLATTSNFDLENSYGQTWLTTDVFGWYTIPLTSTVCDYSTLASRPSPRPLPPASSSPTTTGTSSLSPTTHAAGGAWGRWAATLLWPGSTAACSFRSSATRWATTSAWTTPTL